MIISTFTMCVICFLVDLLFSTCVLSSVGAPGKEQVCGLFWRIHRYQLAVFWLRIASHSPVTSLSHWLSHRLSHCFTDCLTDCQTVSLTVSLSLSLTTSRHLILFRKSDTNRLRMGRNLCADCGPQDAAIDRERCANQAGDVIQEGLSWH